MRYDGINVIVFIRYDMAGQTDLEYTYEPRALSDAEFKVEETFYTNNSQTRTIFNRQAMPARHPHDRALRAHLPADGPARQPWRPPDFCAGGQHWGIQLSGACALAAGPSAGACGERG